MVGLDATDAKVIQMLAARGYMPHLGALLARGRFVRLESPAHLYAGGVWPTFYTSQALPWHGVFHSKQWRPDAMRVEAPTNAWVPARPLWESFTDDADKVCVVDVPMVLDVPVKVDGVSVNGWGTHDLLRRGSWPPDLWRELRTRFGNPRMAAEQFGHQSSRSLSELKQMLIDSTHQQLDLAVHLLNSRPWRFGCVILGATHRVGHYLWDLDQAPAAYAAGARLVCGLPTDLVDVYACVDEALGRLTAAAPDDALIMAFSAHGMGPNSGWSDLFADIVAALQHLETGRPPPTSRLYRLKRRVPHHWIRPLLTRLPKPLSEQLTKLWSTRMYDWRTTRFFPVPMDAAGYVRINLKGREAQGIVEPAEYDQLCGQLEKWIGGLRDAETGEGITGPIVCAYRDADPAAPARHLLPDLVIPFSGRRAMESRRLVCSELPGFEYRVPRQLPSGRSGNHTDGAWLVAQGPGVLPGEATTRHNIIDILPTALQWLGRAPDPRAQGKPIRLQ